MPEYTDGYYQRALAYAGLRQSQRSQDEYRQYVLQGLADLDQAIALSPAPPGDYFMARYEAYSDLAGITELRPDRDLIWTIGLENLRMANALGHHKEFAERTPPLILVDLGRCDEALEEARALIEARGPGAPPSGDLNAALGLAYLCKGDLSRALAHTDVAIDVQPIPYRMYSRAVILFNLGRLEESLEIMDTLIKEDPYYSGYRYYFRALILHDLGRAEEAASDLEFGSLQTWESLGVAAYVRGRILADSGEREEGIEQLQLAEASLSRILGPFFDRVRAELADLGAGPLPPAVTIDLTATPIATPVPSITPRPTARIEGTPPPEGALFDVWKGTGPVRLRGGDYPVYRFQAPAGISVSAVQSVIVHLVSSNPLGQLTLQVYLWNTNGGWGMVNQAQWGANPVDFPERYVLPNGDIVLAVRNFGTQAIDLDNIAVSIEARLKDGSTVRYGWETD
ncbi:MAG TPA: tetratricopeptide repeat protein [Candidatus Methylomirabilis sp.]